MPREKRIRNLWKGTQNTIVIGYPGDASGKVWEWRFKRELEDKTVPIKQGLVEVVSTSPTRSVGRIVFTLADVPDLEGLFYLDCKLYPDPDRPDYYPSYGRALQVNVTPTLYP